MSGAKNFAITVSNKMYGDYGYNSLDFYSQWCRHNCQGEYDIFKFGRNEIAAFFDLESDAVMFTLRWS
jgi:hypothetical protein